MMFKLDATQLNWVMRDGIHYGVAEASELGLPVGEWPAVLIVRGRHETRLFHDETLPHPDAEAKASAQGRYYGDNQGCVIHILND